MLESARQTIGVPCVTAEREYLMALGAELRHSREQKERVGLRLSALSQADPELHALGVTIGRVTTGLLIAEGLDPRAYANSSSYCKAFGLNLKEKSSGQHQGQIKITKRGSGPARRDLYLATLRLINHNEIVSTWYEKKVQAQGGRDKLKIVVALMRKLSRALWYVARGQVFEPQALRSGLRTFQKQETRNTEDLPCHPDPRRAIVLTGFRRSDLQSQPWYPHRNTLP